MLTTCSTNSYLSPPSTPPDLPPLRRKPHPRVYPIPMASMPHLLRRLLHPSSPPPPHHHLTLFQSHKSLFHIRLPQFHPFPTLPITNPPNVNRLMIMKMASVFPAITNFPSLLLMERKILLGGWIVVHIFSGHKTLMKRAKFGWLPFTWQGLHNIGFICSSVMLAISLQFPGLCSGHFVNSVLVRL